LEEIVYFQKVLTYYRQIKDCLPSLPKDITILDPYDNGQVKEVMHQFYEKYYDDDKVRKLILGINPGRLGAGTTGIPFTDPVRLVQECHVPCEFKSYEPSSVFVYKMIHGFGGVEAFYNTFFISSVSPIGFTKGAKNFNYYDDPNVFKKLKPYLVHQMESLIKLPLDIDRVFCWGEGKNYQFISLLNKEFKWFKTIIPMPHPRYIMQYKQKQLESYIDRYLDLFANNH
jgi:Domain of unknown function (DUF4918)